MKRIFIIGVMSFFALTAFAQDYNPVTIITQETFGEREIIRATGIYTPEDPAMVATEYTWELSSCTPDGEIIGHPIISETFAGSPEGEYRFPGSETLPAERNYMITLSATDINGRRAVAYAPIYVSLFTISSATNFCCGGPINVTGIYTYNPAAQNHIWSIYQCDQQGNTYGASYVENAMNGNPGAYTFPVNATSAMGCNQYLLVQLSVLLGTFPTQYYQTVFKIIHINAPVQAAITGSASCGIISASATPTGVGYTYTWSAFNGNTPYNPINASGSNMSAGPGVVNKAQVIVTDPNGCTGTATQNINNPLPNMTGNFNMTFTSTAANEYYITINRMGNYSLTGVYDAFSVMDVANGNMSWKPCWTSSTPTWGSNIRLSGFDGASFMGFPMSPNTCPGTMYTNGRFYKDKTYYIEHYLTYNGCSFPVHKYFNWSQGVISCWGCRTGAGEEGSMETVVDPLDNFDVFPNPSNGAFMVMLNEEVENAQGELINVLGERVDAFTFSGSSYGYSPSQTLTPGIYLLRLTNNGKQLTKRIIIE